MAESLIDSRIPSVTARAQTDVPYDPALQRSASEDLIQANTRLEERTRELEAFSYSVSHDLRAPLRHIMGFVNLLEKDAGQALSEKSLRYLGTISRSAKRMGALIDDLLTFSRVGLLQINDADVDLGVLLQETLGEFQAETKDRHITWKIEPLPRVWIDIGLMRMVWVNLISNALKFTRHTSETTIEIGSVCDSSGETSVFVKDNGAGFDPRYADKLFGVFQRLHSQEEFEGTGIGLANVQRIVQRFGGRVWAEGVVGAGATFHFSIPPDRLMSLRAVG